MSMLPVDVHKRLDPDLIAVPTHDCKGLPVVFVLDGVPVRYAPRDVYEEFIRNMGWTNWPAHDGVERARCPFCGIVAPEDEVCDRVPVDTCERALSMHCRLLQRVCFMFKENAGG